MKKLFITLVACFLLFSCNDSDDNGCKDTSGLVGTWELIKEEGYEIDGDNQNEWSEKDEDYDKTYVFDCGGAGEYLYYEHYEGGGNESGLIEWQYNKTGKELTITYVEADDVSTYNVNSISATTLVLIEHTIDSEYDYEYYNKATYSKM